MDWTTAPNAPQHPLAPPPHSATTSSFTFPGDPTSQMSQSAPTPQAGASSTLYAQATKEWVLPPRPKPGRKPKKDASVDEDDVAIEEARKSQNRASQRAFRERRQDQLATLQARLQQYEQGETERYIQLQNIGKRLKEENDQLRNENMRLKEEMAALKAERDAHVCVGTADPAGARQHRKRVSSVHSEAATASAIRKRARSSVAPVDDQPSSALPPPTPTSQSNICTSRQSPMSWTSATTPASTLGTTPSSYAVPSPSSSMDLGSSSRTNMPGQTSQAQHTAPAGTPTLPAIDDILSSRPSADLEITNCGFCSEDTPCICREIARQGAEQSDIQGLKKTFGTVPESPVASSSILDNPPPFQPAVPLRRKQPRPAGSSFVFPVFDVHATLTEAQAQASCTGDPANCDACRDDTFGRAFCSAISATGTKKCAGADCECNRKRALTLPRLETMQPVGGSAPMGPPTIIPRNFAWRTLKAHPAIQQKSFNNLDLLAEVVVGGRPGSRCSSHHHDENDHDCSVNKDTATNDSEGGCSSVGMTEVPMEGVQHALAILDRHMEGEVLE